MDVEQVPEIAEWLGIVERREVPVCREQIALAAHIRKCFDEEDLTVDRDRLDAYMASARHFFPLRPEEKAMTALWLCTYRADGMPRWPEQMLLVGRGYGKTALMGYWSYCMMSPANGIPYYDVDVCATTEEQARLAYDDLRRMMEQDKLHWQQAFTWNREEMTAKPTGSRFKYWSGNSSSKDGMRSGCVLFDEEHAYSNTKSMEVFEGGLGKKAEPRICKTTTDGDVRDGPLDDDKQRAHRILFDGEPDSGFLPFIFKLDDVKEIDGEAMWPKANPALLDRPVLMEEYRREVGAWRANPDAHTAVPTKRFNMPAVPKARAVAAWDDLTACMRPLEVPEGAPCVVGIDFAKTTDMVGACALWQVDGEWRALCHAWFTTCSQDVDRIKAPLEKWANEGLITITGDVEVEPETVAEWVFAATEGHEVRRLAMDSYRYAIMRRALQDYGFEQRQRGEGCVVLCRPSDIMRTQPIISSAFARHAIAWGENPLMRWAANNAKLEPRPNGNFVYGKQDVHARKTDPFMAFVHAFCVSDALEDPEAVPVEFMAPIVL